MSQAISNLGGSPGKQIFTNSDDDKWRIMMT